MSREVFATRWIVCHAASATDSWNISDNFLTSEAAQAFAARQLDKGRVIVSVERDDNYRLDF